MKAIDAALLATARRRLDALLDTEALDLAVGEHERRIRALVKDHYGLVERRVTAWYEDLVNKYAVTLHQLEAARDEATARFTTHLKGLGYE